MKLSAFLLRMLSILFGVCLGLFTGLIIFGTVLRVTLNSLFHWGDSGPAWINWMILAVTGLLVFISAYIFNRLTNSFLREKANE